MKKEIYLAIGSFLFAWAGEPLRVASTTSQQFGINPSAAYGMLVMVLATFLVHNATSGGHSGGGKS